MFWWSCWKVYFDRLRFIRNFLVVFIIIIIIITTTTTTIIITYLLTAIGLSPGGSSPTLEQTKIKIHKTTITTKQLQNTKQQNNHKTIKISTQTEHSKCKYISKYVSK
jgi:hypothetical protein